MPNTIALAKNYTNLLDEVYRSASVTADLTSDKTMSRAGANANEIIYPQISVTGLGDYDRNSGYTTGAVDLKWQTVKFNYDRGTKISVDVMDNEESRNLAFGMAGATLMREKIAPEADAFTFAVIAGMDGITKSTGSIEGAVQFLDALLTAWTQMEEAVEGLAWYMSEYNHDNHGARKESGKIKAYDFDVDQWRIYSAFMRQYGIDLNRVKMHWFVFMGLLTNLEECSFTRVVDIRMKKAAPGSSKKEKEELRELKDVYRLEPEGAHLTPGERLAQQRQMEIFNSFMNAGKE